MASSVAPKNIASAPPNTPNQRVHPAWRNSLNRTKPHKIPRRLLVFHRGKATLSPISRIAKIVSVLATAHRQPARTAQTIKCGACRTSARMCDVPHECRHAPTCKEYSDHHDERDHERRNADGHKLRGCLGGSEPSARGKAAKDPQGL